MIWRWHQWVVKGQSVFRNLVAVLFKSAILPEFIVFTAALGGSRGGHSAQHQRVAVPVNAACNLMGTFLSYTCEELSWRLVLFRGRISSRGLQRMMPMQCFPGEFSGKEGFAGEWDRGQKKPCCGLFSVHPSRLLWFALPAFEPLLLDWAPGWPLAKSVWCEEHHRHRELQGGDSPWPQAAAQLLLSPATEAELWTQLSPADLCAFIITLKKKKWKDH